MAATVWPCGEDGFRLHFDTPQLAVAPGQFAVLYDGDLLLGGGVIERPLGPEAWEEAPR